MSKYNEIRSGFEALVPLLTGMQETAGLVSRTLGPGGGNVKYKKYGSYSDTKDGYTVVQNLKFKDEHEEMGLQMLREAALSVVNEAGDGTSSVIIIATEMCKGVLSALRAGENSNRLRDGLVWAREKSLELLDTLSVSADTKIWDVAYVASNGDAEIADSIAEIHAKVGNAFTTVEVSNSGMTRLSIIDGLELNSGFVSHYLFSSVTNGQPVCELEKPLVLLCDHKITSQSHIVPLLQHIANSGRSLLIVAQDIDGEALGVIVKNRWERGLRVCAIKAPGFSDESRMDALRDLAALTGAQIVSDKTGKRLEEGVNYLGEATSAVIKKDKSAITNDSANKASIADRCVQIKEALETASSYEREQLQKRLGMLMHGAAVISVGGDNEKHAKTRKDLVEDAVLAARAAVEGGIVAGGGATYSDISARIRDANKEFVGASIFAKALQSVERVVLGNSLASKHEADIVLFSLEEMRGRGVSSAIAGEFATPNSRKIPGNPARIGYDARNRQIKPDLTECGIVDSTKGIGAVMRAATRVALDFLSLSAVVLERQDPEDKKGDTPDFDGMA